MSISRSTMRMKEHSPVDAMNRSRTGVCTILNSPERSSRVFVSKNSVNEQNSIGVLLAGRLDRASKDGQRDIKFGMNMRLQSSLKSLEKKTRVLQYLEICTIQVSDIGQ